MSRTLEAKVIFEIDDHEEGEWRVNQDILVKLRQYAETLMQLHPAIISEPVVNKLHASTKTKAED